MVKVGDSLKVKVMEIDGQGRVNLSHKALLAGGADAPQSGNGAFRPRRNDDAPRRNDDPPRRNDDAAEPRHDSAPPSDVATSSAGAPPTRRRRRPPGRNED